MTPVAASSNMPTAQGTGSTSLDTSSSTERNSSTTNIDNRNVSTPQGSSGVDHTTKGMDGAAPIKRLVDDGYSFSGSGSAKPQARASKQSGSNVKHSGTESSGSGVQKEALKSGGAKATKKKNDGYENYKRIMSSEGL